MRALLFGRVAARHGVVRLARRVVDSQRQNGLGAALVAAYGLLAARPCLAGPARGEAAAPIWAMAIYANERRAVAWLASCVGQGRIAGGRRPGLSVASDLVRAALGRPGRRFLRTVRRFCRRHDFLVACRASTAIASALLARAALQRDPPAAVLVTSDYNAQHVGLAWAARSLGLPAILLKSTQPTHLSPALICTLAILDGEAALDAYRRKGAVRCEVVFKGIEGESRPLRADGLRRPAPTIGVFLPKEVDVDALRAQLVGAQRRFSPARILIRPHPNFLAPRSLDGLDVPGLPIELLAANATPGDDAARCDWVVADETSNVALAVLKAGVPCVVTRGLVPRFEGGSDLYGFVAAGLAPFCESLAELDQERAARFFDAGWEQRFRRWDAGFGLDRAEIESGVRQAVLGVLRH
jgi:hypothetical protein